MTALDIVRMGDPVLRRVADPVEDPTSPEIRTLIADMVDSMHAANGIGLAAPQIGVPKRLLVFYVPEPRSTDDPADGPLEPMALINPVLEPVGDERRTAWEGCLSIPDMRGRVERWFRIRVTGTDGEGRPVDMVVAGTRARVLQHEVDHLDGVLYLDRMTDFRDFGYTAELLAAEQARADLEEAEEDR